jgi:hypothetical protein
MRLFGIIGSHIMLVIILEHSTDAFRFEVHALSM